MSVEPVISCCFTHEAQLYAAYMPFIQNGGLFIRTKEEYALGDEVLLQVQLMNEPEPYQMVAKVIWVTPLGAQGNKPCGVGLQFVGDNSRQLCNKIETYLADMLKSTQTTDTL